MLLTLACVLGLTVADSASASPAAMPNPGVSIAAMHGTGSGIGAEHGAALVEHASAGSAAGHHDGGLALLCLCALIVATTLLTAHRSPLRRWTTEMPHPGGLRWRAPDVWQPARPDPRSWGVSRT
ncbi:hypothetical protein [Isoptericola hypogeus]